MNYIDQIIEVLKGADQDLVWVDSVSTPIRSSVRIPKFDHGLSVAMDELERRGIVEYYCHAPSNPTYVYSAVLTDRFFRQHCRGARKPGAQILLPF